MSSGEVPVGFRFTANGIDDTISRIKQLHSELNNGQITTREYRTGIREVTTETHAATQEFNQIKGAIYAANPTLLELTKTMSGFSAVAQTSLGITTALNIAMLSTSQSSNALQDLKTRYADITLEVDKLSKAFGENDVRTQAAKTVQQELANQIGNEQRQVLIQAIGNWITFGSSLVVATNQGVNLVGLLKTMNANMNPILAENFAIGLSAVGGAFFSIALGAGVAFAGVEAVMTILRLLSPEINDNLNTIAEDIKNTFGIDNLTAQLLSPFYAFLGGLAEIGNGVENFFIYLYNGILNNFINPLITAWDDTIGKITGQMSTLSPENYINQTKQQILQELGLGSTTTSPGLPQNPIASTTNSFLLTGQMKDSVDTQKQTLDTQKISQQLLGNITSTSTMMNDALNSINSSTTLSSQLAQQQLTALNDQKAATQQLKDTLTSQLSDLQAKANALASQPQSQQVTTGNWVEASGSWENQTPGHMEYTTSTVPTDAANQLAQINQQIANAQQQVTVLDNATSGLGPVLQSIGLSSDTGIGSVIAGALGGYAGLGGAGVNASQLQEFANTHDYGVFTAAAIADNTVKTPTAQDQINAWLNAVNGHGMGTFTAADAAKALNLPGSGTSSGSANYDPSGMFGGLPGQYGNPIAAATGFEGMVSGPTHFLAGESGPEFVSISPGAKTSGGVIIYNNTTVQGTVLSEYDLNNTIQNSLKQALKSSGFT